MDKTDNGLNDHFVHSHRFVERPVKLIIFSGRIGLNLGDKEMASQAIRSSEFAEIEKNEPILASWGIKSFYLVQFDQTASVATQYTDVERLIRDKISTNLVFLRDMRQLEQKLTELGLRKKILEMSNDFYKRLSSDLEDGMPKEPDTSLKKEAKLSNLMVLGYVKNVRQKPADCKKIYIEALELVAFQMRFYGGNLESRLSSNKSKIVEFLHFSEKISELKFVGDVARMNLFMLEWRELSKGPMSLEFLYQGMMVHFADYMRFNRWPDALAFEEYKWRAEYFQLCSNIFLMLGKSSDPDYAQFKYYAMLMIQNHIRNVQQQIAKFEISKQIYDEDVKGIPSTPKYGRSFSHYACINGRYPLELDGSNFSTYNEESQKRRIEIEKFSKIKKRTREKADDAIRTSISNPSLPKVTVALKVMRRNLDQLNENSQQVTPEEFGVIWEFEDIYNAFKKSPRSMIGEQAWLPGLLDLESALLLRLDGTKEDLEKYFTDFPKNDWPMNETRPLQLRSRNKYKNIKASFVEENCLYNSTVDLHVDLVVPKIIGQLVSTAELKFNYKEYNVSVSIKDAASSATAESDGNISISFVQQLVLNKAVPGDCLSLIELVLKLEFDERHINIIFRDEERLSQEVLLSYPPHRCDLELKYEPLILDRENTHIKLRINLSENLELCDNLDAGDRSEKEGLNITFTPYRDTDTVIGYSASFAMMGDSITDMHKFDTRGQNFEYMQPINFVNDKSIELDIILFVNSNGSDDFWFKGDLEVKYSYEFKRGEDLTSVRLQRKNNLKRFRIAAKVVNPFDMNFDYQVLNPLLRDANYENNNMKKMFVAKEKGLVVFSLENRKHKLEIESLRFDVNQASGIQVIKQIDASNLILEEQEQAKIHLYFIPQEAKEDAVIGSVYIKWKRASNPEELGVIYPYNEERCLLDRFLFEAPVILARCNAPETAEINKFFKVEFELQALERPLDFKASVISPDFFFVSGASEVRVKLEANKATKITVQALSLKLGLCMLPTLKILDTEKREKILADTHQQFVQVVPKLNQEVLGLKVEPQRGQSTAPDSLIV